MRKEIYVLTNETDEEIVVASESKEKMIDFAVNYVLDDYRVLDEIADEASYDTETDEEYEEEYERLENECREKVRTWATDLVNGQTKYHCSDEFSRDFCVWISVAELI